MKKILFITLFLQIGLLLNAQDLPIFSQYLHNVYYLNPAFIGNKPCKEFYITDRHRWLGFDNAPNMQGIGLYGRFNIFNGKKAGYNGLGATLYNDNNGPNNTKKLQLAASHHIKLVGKRRGKRNLFLAFGFAASGYQYNLDASKLIPDDINDPLITGVSETAGMLNFDAGFSLYNESFTFGFSASQLINKHIDIFQDVDENTVRHFFYFLSYKKMLKWGFGYEPSIVFKHKGTEKQLDLNIKLFFNKYFYAGLSYRHNLDEGIGYGNATSAILGVQVSQFGFAYAFDYSLSDIKNFNVASHEIMLSYRVCNSKKYCKSYDALFQ